MNITKRIENLEKRTVKKRKPPIVYIEGEAHEESDFTISVVSKEAKALTERLIGGE